MVDGCRKALFAEGAKRGGMGSGIREREREWEKKRERERERGRGRWTGSRIQFVVDSASH